MSIQKQSFAADGTFTVPDGVFLVFLSGEGAGGSGAAGNDSSEAASGGGSGRLTVLEPMPVVPGQQISVVIGAAAPGVTASAGANVNGNDGGNTQFGDLIFNGGKGGAITNNTSYADGGVGAANGGDANTGLGKGGEDIPYLSPISSTNGVTPIKYRGGAGDTRSISDNSGGGGGASDKGDGGDALADASSGAVTGQSVPVNTGAGTGGVTNSGSGTAVSADASSGWVDVFWAA